MTAPASTTAITRDQCDRPECTEPAVRTIPQPDWIDLRLCQRHGSDYDARYRARMTPAGAVVVECSHAAAKDQVESSGERPRSNEA